MNKHSLFKPEFDDYMKVFENGAEKYEADGWLKPNGAKTSLNDMYASINRHISKSLAGVDVDDESGLDHLLHVISRCQMLYTRKMRGVFHDED